MDYEFLWKKGKTSEPVSELKKVHMLTKLKPITSSTSLPPSLFNLVSLFLLQLLPHRHLPIFVILFISVSSSELRAWLIMKMKLRRYCWWSLSMGRSRPQEFIWYRLWISVILAKHEVQNCPCDDKAILSQQRGNLSSLPVPKNNLQHN